MLDAVCCILRRTSHGKIQRSAVRTWSISTRERNQPGLPARAVQPVATQCSLLQRSAPCGLARDAGHWASSQCPDPTRSRHCVRACACVRASKRPQRCQRISTDSSLPSRPYPVPLKLAVPPGTTEYSPVGVLGSLMGGGAGAAVVMADAHSLQVADGGAPATDSMQRGRCNTQRGRCNTQRGRCNTQRGRCNVHHTPTCNSRHAA